MDSYVHECLNRIKHLVGMYEVATETLARSHIEYRTCKEAYSYVEMERAALQGLLEAVMLQPSIPFDNRDMLQQGVVALKKLRRRPPWEV